MSNLDANSAGLHPPIHLALWRAGPRLWPRLCADRGPLAPRYAKLGGRIDRTVEMLEPEVGIGMIVWQEIGGAAQEVPATLITENSELPLLARWPDGDGRAERRHQSHPGRSFNLKTSQRTPPGSAELRSQAIGAGLELEPVRERSCAMAGSSRRSVVSVAGASGKRTSGEP